MKKLVFILALLASSGLSVTPAQAQGCSVCTKTASGLDTEKANGLNAGIVYLALLPLAIMGTIGTLWYRHQKHSKDAAPEN